MSIENHHSNNVKVPLQNKRIAYWKKIFKSSAVEKTNNQTLKSAARVNPLISQEVSNKNFFRWQ